MSIFFQLCKKDGDVEGDPELKLTEYTISEVNWLTSSIEHDLEGALHKDFEYIIEIKGEILPSETTVVDAENVKYKEEQDAKKLITWAFAPGGTEEVYKRITIEVYGGGEVETIKDIEIEKRSKIRNDSMREAYVVSYTESFPGDEGRGQFVIQFREKLIDTSTLSETSPKPSTKPSNNTTDDGSRYVKVEYLALFKSTEDTSTVLNVIPYGSLVTWTAVNKTDDDKINKGNYSWIEVTYNGFKGFVDCNYINTEEPPQKDFKTGIYGEPRIINSNNVEIRKLPCTESDTINTCNINQEIILRGTLKIKSDGEDWIKAEYAGQTGWVASGLLKGIPKKEIASEIREKILNIAETFANKTATDSNGKLYGNIGYSMTMDQGIDEKGNVVKKALLRNRWVKVKDSKGNVKFWLDCSSFVGKVYQKVGLSHYNAGQNTKTLPNSGIVDKKFNDPGRIDRQNLLPGDMVYYKNRASHVGIFVGFDSKNKIIAYECSGAGTVPDDHTIHVWLNDEDTHWVHKTVEDEKVDGCFYVDDNGKLAQKYGTKWRFFYRLKE